MHRNCILYIAHPSPCEGMVHTMMNKAIESLFNYSQMHVNFFMPIAIFMQYFKKFHAEYPIDGDRLAIWLSNNQLAPKQARG